MWANNFRITVNNINSTTANIHCYYDLVKENNENVLRTTFYYYLNGSNQGSTSSSSYVCTNIPSGQSNTLQAIVSIYYQIVSTTIDESGTVVTSYSYKTVSINSSVVTIYTKGGYTASDFWKNGNIAIGQGKTIQNHITKANVNQWLTALGVWKSWEAQANWYKAYDDDKDPTGLITANWYNKMAGYCNSSHRVSQNDLITANDFIVLAEAIT